MTTLATGVPGLDVVLRGGLERGETMILAGPPGTGKTILAQQICFAAAAAGLHAVFYTTLSEPHAKIVKHLEAFDFFVPESMAPSVEHVHLGDLLREDASGRLEPLVEEVVRKAMVENPAVVVIDSAKALREFSGDRDFRLAMYDLTSRMVHADTALVLIGEYTADEMTSGVEFALADGIIHLAYEPREPIDRRWLRVTKMRGRNHLQGKHTFRIGSCGLEVFPRIETVDPGPPAKVTGRICSGTPGLDEMMGGGIGAGEATVVLGPSGVGKTILSLNFVAEAVDRGERCLYITFQDTGEQLIKMAASFGWDLSAAATDGRLVLHHVPLGELDLDILTMVIRGVLAGGSIRRVVIDSLAEMVVAARESERVPAYTRNLTGLIRASGASLLITSETATFGPSRESPAGLTSFLFHNVIMLRYLELNSTTGRAIGIVKMRNSQHDKSLHEFQISQDGLSIGATLEDVRGVLGWSALRAPVE